MKNILIMCLSLSVVLAACSKEKKVNKRLDGSWMLTAENDKAVTEGTTVLTFNKEKKEGTGTVVYTDSKGNSTTTNFSYTLDKNILTTTTNSYTVTEYTKDDLSLLSTNGTFELRQDFKRN
ncbi:MAG: hypothetical protein ACSHXL_07990 [Bacteroidota bacterium]